MSDLEGLEQYVEMASLALYGEPHKIDRCPNRDCHAELVVAALAEPLRQSQRVEERANDLIRRDLIIRQRNQRIEELERYVDDAPVWDENKALKGRIEQLEATLRNEHTLVARANSHHSSCSICALLDTEAKP